MAKTTKSGVTKNIKPRIRVPKATLTDGTQIPVKDLVQEFEANKQALVKANTIANEVVGTVGAVIENSVPKDYLKAEGWIEKVRIFLEGKGSWVKFTLITVVSLLGLTVGIGAEQVLSVLMNGEVLVTGISDIITGILVGGGTAAGFLGTIFSKSAKKFDAKKDVKEVKSDGTIVLNG